MHVPALDLDAFTGLPFPVATRSELRRAGTVAIEAMGHRLLAVWNDGDPRVYEDACAHLGYPLSLGKLRGDRMVCAYHGWEYACADGRVTEQPGLRRPRPCGLERHGCLVAGELVFAWIGDPEAMGAARARLPAEIPEGTAVHRVDFACPFYLALFNAVDYAHFPRHSYYSAFYALYRRLRRNGHVPGQPFSTQVVDEDEHRIRLRIEEAGREIRMYATAAEFVDDSVNHFQTFVTPVGPSQTIYWETFRARSGNPFVRLAAKLAFHTVIVALLEGEDRDWTGGAAPAFLTGRNIHLAENDVPLGAHLKKFVLPRLT